MLDHASPARPPDAHGRDQLASLHRELAANFPWPASSPPTGAAADRNVALRLRAPFPLQRLPAP